MTSEDIKHQFIIITAASLFPQCPCSSRSSVSSSCCLCIWFRVQPVGSYFSMACCSVVSHWCKWCTLILLPCSQRALILVLEHMGNFGIRLSPGCSHHGVSVHCLCIQMLSFYATKWPVLPTCMQLTLVSWYVASMLYVAIVGCSVWVMLCRCNVIPLKYGSFVRAAVQISVRHDLFV